MQLPCTVFGSAKDSSIASPQLLSSRRNSSVGESSTIPAIHTMDARPAAPSFDNTSYSSTAAASLARALGSSWNPSPSVVPNDVTEAASSGSSNAASYTLDLTRRQRPPKSIGSSTTLSSQPVIVRTYTGSRQSSRLRSPQLPTFPPHMSSSTRLPPVDEFSFENILRAVDSEINGTIDAIAEICARSRLSLADEYSAHLPPQGEILPGSNPPWRSRHGHVYRNSGHDHTLTAVPEASSSSEQLAGGSRASSSKGKGKSSAVGSLRSIISGSKMPTVEKSEARAGDTSRDAEYPLLPGHPSTRPSTSRSTRDRERRPSIALLSSPTVATHLSLESSVAVATAQPQQIDAILQELYQLETAEERTRARMSSPSTFSWLPWARASASPSSLHSGRSAETNLRDILRTTITERDKRVAGCG